jgi:hypothetical protein
VGFLRREEPLHEKLAREGGLDFQRSVQEPGVGPLDPQHPLWQVAGIHGVPRAREWDATATAEAPGLPGGELEFVVMEDSTLVVDEDLPDDALTPIADELENTIAPPYHALARRWEGDLWSAAAMEVDIVDVPEDVSGDEVVLAVQDGERTLTVDGEHASEELPTLEAFGMGQYEAFVLQASRLDGTSWEVTVTPL